MTEEVCANMSWVCSSEPSSAGVRTELSLTIPVKEVTEGLSVGFVTALSCSVTGNAVGFSVLNTEDAVGGVVCLLDISVVCTPELSSSSVGKIELVSGVTDTLSV